MTAQIPDTVKYQRREYSITGVNGQGLFDPVDFGLELRPFHSACWRGFVAHYSVRSKLLIMAKLELGLSDPAMMPDTLYGAKPIHDQMCYRDSPEPVPFSGGLLLGNEFIQELYVHMGFHPPWKYKYVQELIFEAGYLVKATDRSQQMEELRDRILKGDGPEPPETMMEWIRECFDLSYPVGF